MAKMANWLAILKKESRRLPEIQWRLLKMIPRLFVNRQSEIIDEGYPLASIQIVAPVNKFKSELTREEEAITMDIEQQPIFDFL